MPLTTKYRQYFDIDPEYLPVVNDKAINDNPELWKKFFPHETFINLVKNTIRVLERKQRLCLWVEGAYGTGKSHAVHTLKKLLDSSEAETYEYFQRHHLDNDLYNQLQSIKSAGQLLTVHRYGSSSIQNDHNLIFAVQESVMKALEEAGIQNKGNNALKEAAISWLSDKHNKNFFNSLVTEKYVHLFGGDDADAVIDKLKTFSGEALEKVMNNIFKVADERQIKALSLSVKDLTDWIRELIIVNNLKAIVFIWDEFTEYFRNNTRNLTGFQELCEISLTDPFYFVLVTHATQSLFHDRDQDFSKLNDRFVSPHCQISLPENIAFQLMGAALVKNPNPAFIKDWEESLLDLTSRTKDSRKLVKDNAHISDKEMTAILPIHPYAALLLKHISAAFDSNQRSMFDFIKNDRGDEIKGFQWFIDNHGVEDDNPFLSVDMLWDFFYEKGKESLAPNIRSILDYYNHAGNKKLDSDEKRVLKTVLLLQAISFKAGDSVELFIPNDKNLNNAFEGTDLDASVSQCAKKLVRDKILYQKDLGDKKFQYAAYSHDVDVDLTEQEEGIDKKSTTAFITEELSDKKTKITDAVELEEALKLRFELRYVSSSDFDSKVKQLQDNAEKFKNKIVAVVCFAKDESESAVINKKIHNALANGIENIVFIDTSLTPLGNDNYLTYRRYMAKSIYLQSKDSSQAKQYADNAKEILKNWKDNISKGEFFVYTQESRNGEHVATLTDLNQFLFDLNKKKFIYCLEGSYNVLGTMYTPSNLKQGVVCAYNEKTTGTFNSNKEERKLENALKGAWKTPEYWKTSPNLLISKIKLCVEKIIADSFKDNGQISIKVIYDTLKEAPYGFMPCNLSAFILGFVLKEYVNGQYSWSDGLTNEALDVDKLKDMIAEVINLEITPNPRYREKYIVAVTEEEKAFNKLTSEAFDIAPNLCTSVPNTRERIRGKMKEYSFPIWTLKFILEKETTKTDVTVLAKIIDAFCGIANTNNQITTVVKKENTIVIELGALFLANPDAACDLKPLLNKKKCTEGMIAYLSEFENGELERLAESVGDNGQYVNVLRKKFDADAANWVWNEETVQQKIKEVILEYQIIAESNKLGSKNISYTETIQDWCRKCKYIRISYTAAQNDLDGLKSFLEMLHLLKKSGDLRDSQKEEFLKRLQANIASFKDFFSNQVDLFKRVCGYYLVDLTDEEIQEVFGALPEDLFTYGKSEYLNLVEKSVHTYKEGQKKSQLKALWKAKTGTENPQAWSKKHMTPILCLIPDEELEKARAAFNAVNQIKADESTIDHALEYFETAKFFDVIHDQAAIDKAFQNNIIRNYAVILTDIQEVKDYLDSQISADPYDWWFALPEIDKKLRKMAEAKYSQDGYKLALAEIDKMGISDAKKFLKELIQNNMVVGIEIIKNAEGEK